MTIDEIIKALEVLKFSRRHIKGDSEIRVFATEDKDQEFEGEIIDSVGVEAGTPAIYTS